MTTSPETPVELGHKIPFQPIVYNKDMLKTVQTVGLPDAWKYLNGTISHGLAEQEYLMANSPLAEEKYKLAMAAVIGGMLSAPIPLESLLQKISDMQLTRRQGLKAAGAAAIGAVLPNEKSKEQSTIEDEAYAAEGMAWNLLMKVNDSFGSNMADLIAQAFYHTSKIYLRTDHNYKYAKELFLRMADSMLKLGMTRALQGELDRGVEYDQDTIRSVIDKTILKGQHLDQISKYLQETGKAKPKDPNTIGWAWRVTPRNNKSAAIFTQTARTGWPDAMLPVSGGEMIMAKMVKANQGSYATNEWFVTPFNENVKDAAEIGLNLRFSLWGNGNTPVFGNIAELKATY